jgi:hypothetical protein
MNEKLLMIFGAPVLIASFNKSDSQDSEVGLMVSANRESGGGKEDEFLRLLVEAYRASRVCSFHQAWTEVREISPHLFTS